ncbi:MAG TPA: TraB/GumN family protein [Deltaproteobacteria bacterium]|nr:TraB/GumN family protein [Deltaproteobacteria bacterium]HXK48233.1 TraB/GumN family protein [Deltaproteobacteria bacterium]
MTFFRHAAIPAMAVIVVLLAVPGDVLPAQTGGAREHPVFMWSVQGPASRAYILGSLHALKRVAYPLDARIEKAYRSCPQVLLEADPSVVDQDELRETMLRLGTYPDDMTLKKAVSPATYARLRKRVEAGKIDMDRFERFRPWLAAFSIATLELKRLGFSAQDGVDTHFYRKALSDGKRMIYLETAVRQMEMLSEASSGRDEDILRQALDELDMVEKYSDDMVRAWELGDARRMETLLKKSLEGFPSIEKKLFAERNKAWAERIGTLLTQEGDVFVVVGAGHLVGGDGLLEELRARKFTVVQQ